MASLAVHGVGDPDTPSGGVVPIPGAPRRSPRCISSTRHSTPVLDGSRNVGGLPFRPLLPDEEGVVPQPRRNSLLACEELPEGVLLRQNRVLGSHWVTVFPSTIPLAGRGLFAFRTIPPHSEVAEYKGLFSTLPPLDGTSPFTMELPDQAGYITGDPSTCFGVFMNDCFDDLLTNTRIRWCSSRQRAFVVSGTLPINPGEECFTSFGGAYWSSESQRALLSHDHAHIAAERWQAESLPRVAPQPPALLPTPTPPPPREWWQSASDSSDTSDTYSLPSPKPVPLATSAPTNLTPVWLSDSESDSETVPADVDGDHPSLDILPEPPPLHASRESWLREAGVRPLWRWIHHFFPDTGTEEAEINDLLSQSFELGSSVFGIEAANGWADKFVIPPEAIARDDAMWVACNNQFDRMVEAKRRAIAQGRLSVQRINEALHPVNPHRDAVMDLAVNGISLCTPSSYTGCGVDDIPPLGKMFIDTAAPVEKMMFESYWEEGLSIILTERRVRTMESLGLCLASWAAKLGKACGRPITNGSGRRGMPSSQFINGKRTKLSAMRKYGHIRNPVIGDVARLIQHFCSSRHITTGSARIWKYDIAAAYQKLTYPAAAVSHVGVELRDHTFMFFLGGVFGLTSMPFAFNVITKAVVWELNTNLIKGRMLQYVDDGFVVSHVNERDDDVATTLSFIRNLLGPDAIAVHKLDMGDSFDFIGYNVDRLSELVTVSRRNIHKSIYFFNQVNLDDLARVPVRIMQRLASLGSRYSQICSVMRPLVRTLYESYHGIPQQGSVSLSAEAKVVIRTFRGLFTLMGLRVGKFSRTFESFEHRHPSWVCEFDASLSGVGIIWFQRTPEGAEIAKAWAQVDIRSLNFGEDSSFQNTSEYIGSLLCARGLTCLGVSNVPILLRGDSVSALSWARKGTVRSAHASRASALWAQYASLHQIEVVDVAHLAHEVNTRTDILSRQGSWAQVIIEDRLRYGGTLPHKVPQLDLQSSHILALVDPSLPLDSDAAFNKFFGQCLHFGLTPVAPSSAFL